MQRITTILRVGCRKQVVGCVVVGVGVVFESVAGVGEVDAGKNLERVDHVTKLEGEQLPVVFVRKRILIGRHDGAVGLGVAGSTGNAEQVVARRIGQVG